MVHISPHWNWPGREGKPVNVVVFSNAAMVELTLSGVSLGRKPCSRDGHCEWTVNYAPGMLVANGSDARGHVIATETVSTASKPYRVKLKTKKPKKTTNGQDATVVEAAIVDDKGRFVPVASNEVTFTVSGSAGVIAGTGNGDPNDHTPDASPVRNAFNGHAAAVVRSTGKRGLVKVTAKARGLRSETISVEFD